jgi:hypothetical protein
MAGAFAIPTADAILLLLMFAGLLLRAHGNKVGIWRVLYNQVTLNSSLYSSPQLLKILLVYNLDGLGGIYRDTTVGPWSFKTLL